MQWWLPASGQNGPSAVLVVEEASELGKLFVIPERIVSSSRQRSPAIHTSVLEVRGVIYDFCYIFLHLKTKYLLVWIVFNTTFRPGPHPLT